MVMIIGSVVPVASYLIHVDETALSIVTGRSCDYLHMTLCLPHFLK